MVSEVITEAQKRLLAPRSERLLIWSTSLTTAALDEDFLSDNAADLSSLIFSTLLLYFDRDSQAVVRAFIGEVVKNDVCLKGLAGGIVKLGSAKLPGHESYVLIRWSCIVLRRMDASSMKKAVDKLLEVQAGLLDNTWKQGFKWHTVSRVVSALLQSKPDLLEPYLQLAVSSVNPGLVKVLLDYTASLDSGTSSDAKRTRVTSALLAAFSEKVLSGKDKPTSATVTAFKGLFAGLDQAGYLQQVHPVLLKQLRRTPDVVLHVLLHTLPHINLDTSKFSLELLPLLVQQIRAKESVRASALATVALLAKHISDHDCLDSLVKSVTSVLNATGADKVKVPAERTALLTVLMNLAEVPGKGESISAAAAQVVDFILKFYKTESPVLRV